MNDKELNLKKESLKKKIMTLEWDKKRHQINLALESRLKVYKEELAKLEADKE